jgi:hypothetical protein
MKPSIVPKVKRHFHHQNIGRRRVLSKRRYVSFELDSITVIFIVVAVRGKKSNLAWCENTVLGRNSKLGTALK